METSTMNQIWKTNSTVQIFFTASNKYKFIFTFYYQSITNDIIKTIYKQTIETNENTKKCTNQLKGAWMVRVDVCELYTWTTNKSFRAKKKLFIACTRQIQRVRSCVSVSLWVCHRRFFSPCRIYLCDFHK